MNVCPKCGLESEAKFCSNCGAVMVEKTPRCPKCGTPVTGRFCPNCGADTSAVTAPQQPNAAPAYTAPTYTAPAAAPNTTYTAAPGSTYSTAASSATQPQYNLGWHKFLIYFAMWAGGILNIINGVRLLPNLPAVMDYYGGSIGITYLLETVLLIAAGAFLIYTRFQLAAFKRNAPMMLLIAYAAAAVINLLDLYLLYTVTGGSASANISSLVSTLVVLVINWRYYSNRKSLFVN